MSDLKIYEMDRGWRGNIIVVAENEKEAREFMDGRHNYDPEVEIQEHEIVKGLAINNLGDM